MNPIINPIWFYIISVLNAIYSMATAFVVVIIIGSLILSLSIVFSYDLEFLDDVKYKKILKTIFIVLVTSCSLIVFVPNEETMYKMMISSYITENNVEIAKEEVKELIDYISEKIKGE